MINQVGTSDHLPILSLEFESYMIAIGLKEKFKDKVLTLMFPLAWLDTVAEKKVTV